MREVKLYSLNLGIFIFKICTLIIKSHSKRKMWQRIQATILLAEHVIIPESDITKKYVYLKRHFAVSIIIFLFNMNIFLFMLCIVH